MPGLGRRPIWSSSRSPATRIPALDAIQRLYLGFLVARRIAVDRNDVDGSAGLRRRRVITLRQNRRGGFDPTRALRFRKRRVTPFELRHCRGRVGGKSDSGGARATDPICKGRFALTRRRVEGDSGRQPIADRRKDVRCDLVEVVLTPG